MTDFEIAAEWALVKWGPTGFRCDACEHDRGYHLKCRARMFECADCEHQQSIVAGTILQASKVPLRTWVIRADYYKRGVVPTSSELARRACVGRTSAWHVNHRWMAAISGKGEGQPFWLTVPARRPRVPLAGEVSQALRAFWTALRNGEAQAATVRVSGESVTLGPAEEHQPHPVGERIAERLHTVHRGVCIRWMKRWVQHYLGLYTEAPRAWLRAMLSQAPLPLCRLAP